MKTKGQSGSIFDTAYAFLSEWNSKLPFKQLQIKSFRLTVSKVNAGPREFEQLAKKLKNITLVSNQYTLFDESFWLQLSNCKNVCQQANITKRKIRVFETLSPQRQKKLFSAQRSKSRSLTLVSFEKASLVEYACKIWSIYLLRFKS